MKEHEYLEALAIHPDPWSIVHRGPSAIEPTERFCSPEIADALAGQKAARDAFQKQAMRYYLLLRRIRDGEYGCWTKQLDDAITETLGDGNA